MVRGAQKQMVVVKINDSDVFEEAYFVIRRGAGSARMDMLSEAERIVESSGAKRQRRGRVSARSVVISLVSFLSGGLVGALVVVFSAVVS